MVAHLVAFVVLVVGAWLVLSLRDKPAKVVTHVYNRVIVRKIIKIVPHLVKVPAAHPALTGTEIVIIAVAALIAVMVVYLNLRSDS